jgi:hypothetical protein
MLRSKPLLALAKGQPCMNCGCEGTTVAAHSNMLIHGKGKGIKAHDCFTAWLCAACHSWLDQGRGMDPTGLYDDTREDKASMWRRAFYRTVYQLWTMELIGVKK